MTSDVPPMAAPHAAMPPSALMRFVLPLVVLSVLIAAICGAGYAYLSGEIRRETQRTLAVIAEQKRQQLEAMLADAAVDAQLYFSGHAQLEALFDARQKGATADAALLASMRRQMADVAQMRGWSGVAVLDEAGGVVVSVGEASVRGQAAPIREVLRTRRIQLVDLYRNDQGEAVYGLLAPIAVAVPGGETLGAVYLTRPADQTLNPLVGSWPVPTQTAETYLVRRDGDSVRFLTPLRHRPGAALTLTQLLSTRGLPAARAAQGEHGILEGGRDYRQVPVLAYAAAVGGTPWLMLAEIDEVEAYAGIRTMAWVTGLVMVLGLSLVYTAAYLMWRRDRQRQELAALQAQRAAEARFRVIFDKAPLGVALVDSATGRVLEANERLGEIVGRPVRELLGVAPLRRITHPDDLRDSVEQLMRLHAGEIPGFRLNKRYVHADGQVVWASVTCAPIRADSEGAIHHLYIVEDISERKRNEQALREASEAAEAANAAKSEFLAHMSHEIRTPMNAVLGLAQVLEREPLPASQRDMVVRIRTAGQALLAILNDVLDLSKIEAGQLRIEPRPFDLGTLLANVDSLMGQAAREKGLVLRLVAPTEALGRLLGDGLRLEQVLLNLTGNAIKFTEHGEVVITVGVLQADGAGVRLRFEVRDTGLGIDAGALGRLFAPFVQADGGISRRFGGTGLGLSICKRLVELMGGEIGADSALGHGSVFWFELPLQHAAAGEADALAPRPAGVSAGPRLVGAHVLVVDDSAMNRDLVERALKAEGAFSTLAADGQQAVQILGSGARTFDAVLMDVQMPVMDGLTATRWIRRELGLTELPIIAFTAGVRDDQQAAARAAGANDVLAKPMDLDQMAQVLSVWIGPRHAEVGEVAPPPATPIAPMAPADDGGFPEVAGIDRERVIQRLSGDREMFIGLLQRFVEDNGDAAQRTLDDVNQGRWEDAAGRMHKLRSNAGFLCALDLMDLAEELEMAFEQERAGQEPKVAELARQITELIDTSAPWR